MARLDARINDERASFDEVVLVYVSIKLRGISSTVTNLYYLV